MGRLFWIVWVDPKYNHTCLNKRGRGRFNTDRRAEGSVEMEARLGRCCHKSRNASGHQKLEKVKNGLPRACRGGAALPTP